MRNAVYVVQYVCICKSSEPLKKQSPSHPRPLSLLAVRVELKEKNTHGRSLRPVLYSGTSRSHLASALFEAKGGEFLQSKQLVGRYVHVHSPCFPRTIRVLFYVHSTLSVISVVLLLRCDSAREFDLSILFSSFLHFFLFAFSLLYWRLNLNCVNVCLFPRFSCTHIIHLIMSA